MQVTDEKIEFFMFKQDHEGLCIESQRIRTAKCKEETHQDQIADQMVHKPIAMPKAVTIREIKAALVKEWTTLKNLFAWIKSKVTWTEQGASASRRTVAEVLDVYFKITRLSWTSKWCASACTSQHQKKHHNFFIVRKRIVQRFGSCYRNQEDHNVVT